MANSASCSSSSAAAAAPFSKKLYDVFISFRGEDTRRSLTSHLYAALSRNQIQAYKDDTTLEKGDEVWPALVHAIENSYLCLVVFSKEYASSTWCLKELTHILDCKKEKQVVPVFYQISPWQVRKQTGSYKEAFQKHKGNPKLNEEVVQKWRYSLEKAANISGFDSESKEYRDDYHLIESIVKDVCQKLKHIYLQTEPEGLVGINKNCADIELLLQEFQSIGLWGMGGLGKTTIARVIFNKYSPQYEGYCLLENVRENSGKLGNGLSGLRKRLFSHLLKREIDHIDAEYAFVKKWLAHKKVFIVLDDVDASEQIEYLVRNINHFGPGSRIIITTRDKHVLKGKVDKIYQVKGLDFQQSLQLFSLNAFDSDLPQTGFEELSWAMVIYANGLPLALKLLGSFFHSRSKEAWESALRKLKRYPYKRIENVLKLSYDGLDDEEKEIFLDIAFFFKGGNKESVEDFLNACNFCATIGLEALQDKALITISKSGIVEMHDLIQEMGWERVREKCIEYPGRRSRLRDPQEICDVLQNNKGSEAIEGIILNLSQIQDLHLSDDAFKKMTKLRFLKFYFPEYWDISNNVYPSGLESFSNSLRSLQSTLYDENIVDISNKVYPSSLDSFSNSLRSLRSTLYDENIVDISNKVYPSSLESFSNSLRYFHWDGFISESLPSTLYNERIVELHIQSNEVKSLGNEAHDLANLKRINLKGCKQLMQFPNFSKALCLEQINLSYCQSLHHVPTTFCVEKVVHLFMRCSGIKKLWDGVQNLVSLKKIDLSGCNQLIELPDLSKALNLEWINLSRCISLRSVPATVCTEKLTHFIMHQSPLKKLWNGVKNLASLEEINLIDSKKLMYLPDLSKASKLKTVSLSNCENLCHIHPSLLSLGSLHELNLRGCKKLESLKSEIPLNNLSSLSLQFCSSLKQFSLISAKLRNLGLSKTAIETLDSSIGHCSNLESLLLNNSQIKSLPNELSNLRSLRKLDISDCRELDAWNFHIILDGLLSLRKFFLYESSVQSLPSCIKYLSSLKYINVSNCKRLRCLPQLPLSLERLEAEDCPSLETVVTAKTSTVLDVGTSFLWNGLLMSFKNCVQLDECSIYDIERDAQKRMRVAAACQCDHPIEFCFPGNEVPRWFRYHAMMSLITIELPLHSDPFGFAFSLILSLEPGISSLIWVECKCYLEDCEIVISKSREYYWLHDGKGRLADHVILWYDENDSEAIMKAIRDGRAKRTSYNPRLSFEFIAWAPIYGKNRKLEKVIKECGVWPIYALEIEYSVEEMEECLELGGTGKDPTKKLKPSFLKELELVLGTASYKTSGIGVVGSEFKYLTQTDFNCLLNDQLSESDSSIISEYQSSIDETELALDADEEEQLPLTENFKESTFQPIPVGLDLEINSECKTCLDNDQIEVGGSSQELSETFSCVRFIGFLWKLISRLISCS